MDEISEIEAEEVPQLSPIDNESVFDGKLRLLANLNARSEELSKALKIIAAEKEGLSYQLAHYMLNSNCKSKELDGKKFTQKQRVYSQVEDKEALNIWIKENDMVDVLMAVHPSKLTAYCNESLEAGGDTPRGVNPNFIKYYVHVK